MFRILFVCTGNTCRSPLAALAARRRWRGFEGRVDVASAGVAAVAGAPASSHARFVARDRGESLEDHCSRNVEQAVAEGVDLVLTMTRGHRDALRARLEGRVELMTLAEFAGRGDEDVDDPFGGSVEDYERALAQIEELLDASRPQLERRVDAS